MLPARMTRPTVAAAGRGTARTGAFARLVRLTASTTILALGAFTSLNAAADCSTGEPITFQPSGQQVTDPAVASRFLQMATFGPRQVDVDYLAGMTIEDWLVEQAQIPSSCHYAQLMSADNPESRDERMSTFWKISLTAPDQLRQRMALALSEILVVSEVGSDLPQVALTWYYDQLVLGASGSYRQLLERAALSPAMGRYLSMLGNQKADAEKGIRADENFARELMQLFTIGLVELNMDGTPRLDAEGKTIPTYTQADVENLARILTGWSFAGTTEQNFHNPPKNWTAPMVPVEAFHDTGEKHLLGKRFRAGLSTERDFKRAIGVLYRHPNVPPFISRQLIQRLVTSNPSPAYVERVAKVFANNGAGRRGDLPSVILAILTDPEALGGAESNTHFGRLREPLLILSHLWRATGAYPPDGEWNYDWPDEWIGQAPLTAPSVFNWFRPNYQPPGMIKDAGLVAPEFEIVNDASITRNLNEIYARIYWHHNAKPDGYDDRQIVLDTRALLPLARNDLPALVDRLELLLTHRSLPQGHVSALLDYLQSVPLESGDSAGAQRVTDAIYLIMSSPAYTVFR